jgi:hypothetical protein
LGRLPHGYMRQDVYLMRWLRGLLLRNINVKRIDETIIVTCLNINITSNPFRSKKLEY